MSRAAIRSTVSPALVSFETLTDSWKRHLLAENKSARTVETYMESAKQLGKFLAGKGMPTAVEHITREHVEAFMGSLLERWKPATASVDYRALQQFFNWLIDEGEVKSSPMERLKKPLVPETPPDVLTHDQITRLLKSCDGRDFRDRRDNGVKPPARNNAESELAHLVVRHVEQLTGSAIVQEYWLGGETANGVGGHADASSFASSSCCCLVPSI
jgi:site-specific recombinase XerC